MTNKNNNTMQFLFADRELVLQVADLLSAPVEVIVNPANGSLAHGGGVAGQIVQQAGDIIQQESALFIKEHGILDSGMVAFTSAGHLPYKAVIHAVGPRMGEGDEQRKIEQAVARSLQLCNMHDWNSIAFPAISTGIFGVPIEVAARAFFRSITSFWDARMDGAPEKIIICLTQKNFQPFLSAFRTASSQQIGQQNFEPEANQKIKEKYSYAETTACGVVELSEQDISALENDEVNDWFK
jgi:O-acetyl-ADP-ribose deacetylase (regulator of RNase III)